MIKAYGTDRRVYYLFDKKTTSGPQALKLAAADMHFKPSQMKLTSADKESENRTEMTFLVERKNGAYWCVSRR